LLFYKHIRLPANPLLVLTKPKTSYNWTISRVTPAAVKGHGLDQSQPGNKSTFCQISAYFTPKRPALQADPPKSILLRADQKRAVKPYLDSRLLHAQPNPSSF